MHRIAIDYTPAHEQGGGIGRYVRELTSALAKLDTHNQYKLFVAGAKREHLLTSFPRNYTWSPTQITPAWLARIWHRANLQFPVELITGSIDLFHATDFVLPPTLPSTKTILTVHDLSFVRVPKTASPQLKAYLDKVVPKSVAKAHHILADSQATKDDLIELYETPDEKITVLLSGVDKQFQPVLEQHTLETVAQKYNLHSLDYFLSVGTVQPRKNYSRIILALKELRNRGLDVHYAIAGGKGWLEDEMYQTIRDTGMENYVHLLGFVDDNDLPALYSSATSLVVTSLYEGFGLPILEAMSCGTPVITSNVSSLPEVAGKAGILIDPYDIAALTDALYRIINDNVHRQLLIDMGHQQAQKFTWEKSAQHLNSIYQGLLEQA